MLTLRLKDQNVRRASLNSFGIHDKVLKQIYEDDKNIFVSRESKNALKKYCLQKSDEDAIKIWKELLIDAICLLKINDRRERLYSDVSEIYDEKNLDEYVSLFSKIRKEVTYGVDELVEYYDDYMNFETVLYGIGDYYRDHIHHVIEVWGIGVGLIEGYDKINIKLNDGYATSESDFGFQIGVNGFQYLTRSEIWAMWIMISLCHDLGYPIEKASKINQKVRKIINHFGALSYNDLSYSFDMLNGFLVDKYLNIVSSKAVRNKEICKAGGECMINNCHQKQMHKTQVQPKYYDKLCKSLESYQHGIFSGMLIYKKLTYFLESDYSDMVESLNCEDLRQFYIRKEILRSICTHTCAKVYHLDLNTLSFLLIICDDLQEWGRPRLRDMLNGDYDDKCIIEIREYEARHEDGLFATNISIVTEYKIEGGVDDEMKRKFESNIVKKFKKMHYLLRGAKDDGERKVKLKWEIKFGGEGAIFDFDTERKQKDVYGLHWINYEGNNFVKGDEIELY